MCHSKRRLLVPEVVQTSSMDCGPACLKSLLGGVGIPASYGRLREACQTDVDGTSIDTLEEIAIHLGLKAEQIMIPVDHLLLSEANALPAIVIVRLPSGYNHFVVAWRSHMNRVVQVMDPATGRRWPTVQQFLNSVYQHSLLVPTASWREWAGTNEFLDPLRLRLTDLGISAKYVNQLILSAMADTNWRSLAILDAVTRMVTAIVNAGGIRRGYQALNILNSFIEQAQSSSDNETTAVPESYWSVIPGALDDNGDAQLQMRGAVLVRVQGILGGANQSGEPNSRSTMPNLAAALIEKPVKPVYELFHLLQADGLLSPFLLFLSIVLAASGAVFEALLFRSLFDLGQSLILPLQRLGAMGIILLFSIFLLMFRFQIVIGVLRQGRLLETRLRMAFLEKIPRLRDQYIHSRPVSDMAHRAHVIHRIRNLPSLGYRFLLAGFTLLFTLVGVIWLSPENKWLAITIGILVIVLPLLMQPLISEQEMRVRTHNGALGRFFLDSFLGLVPILTHGAERAIRHEHESLLIEWSKASLAMYRSIVSIEGIQLLLSYLLIAFLIFKHFNQNGEISSILLLVYWLLTIPAFAQEFSLTVRQYPIQRNMTLRLLEPLGALEDELTTNQASSVNQRTSLDGSELDIKGVQLCLKEVKVRISGHTILQNINLSINAGEHIAIVGPSGSGKSTLVGLLLGWYRLADGKLLVDGRLMDGTVLTRLRRTIAWVDPTVQLWNRSLAANLLYGKSSSRIHSLVQVIDQANLVALLQRLPEGLQTSLGESGGLVSGGEGQRVRLGRAMLREGVRLVILDEPFRGLDRNHRRRLLLRARELWSDATLLCITHDVMETKSFDRVLVMEEGLLSEDGIPSKLLKQANSRYRYLFITESQVRQNLWSHNRWRKLKLQGGVLMEEEAKA